MATVGSHQQAPFTTPLNATSPVDADEVRLNDNALQTTYNSHDSDATIHVQSSTLSLRPPAGTEGRLWFTSDTRRFYYDDGVSWLTLTLSADDLTAGTLAVGRGGTGLSTAPTNGQLLIGNGTTYTLGTLSAGTNIAITNGAGSITINATGTASGVSGTGTSGVVPRWVSGTTIGDGVMQDDGTNVGVGQAPDATFKLTVVSLKTTGSSLALNNVSYAMPGSQGSASSVLTNNGSGTLTWTVPAQPLDQQTFDSSGTWTKPSQGSMALVEVWGAGGSGSFSVGTAADNNGGAGGGYMQRLIKVSDLGATETVTVGAGGASRTTAANGFTGGNSSFGSWATAYGGVGGQLSGTSTLIAYGGSPERAGQAVAAGTTLSIAYLDYYDRVFGGGWASTDATNHGQTKNSVYGGGAGGNRSGVAAGTSVFGGAGGAAGTGSTPGSAGTIPGGGGGGGGNASSQFSGAGANGRVRITVW